MKSRLRTVAFVAVAHLLLFWITIGLLKASGFTIFNLFEPPPRNSPAQVFLFDVVGVMSYPMAWLTELLALPDKWFTVIPMLLLNSGLWGACLGLLIHGLRHRRSAQGA
jgi:hypothetical protein